MTPAKQQKKSSYRNGDRTTTPAMLLLFFVAAVLLHLLFAICFHNAPAEPVRNPDQQRTIRMIPAEQHHTGYSLADPTIFVHGTDSVGYSKAGLTKDDRKPELSIRTERPVLSEPEKYELQEITAPERQELPYLSANAALLGAPGSVKRNGHKKMIPEPVGYPAWLDHSGNDLNSFFSKKQIETLKALNISGQTTFKATPGANGKVQCHVMLLRSCGDPAADTEAKNILEQALSDPGFRKTLVQKEGTVFRLCWTQQLAALPLEKDLPAMMFPEEESNAKKGVEK